MCFFSFFLSSCLAHLILCAELVLELLELLSQSEVHQIEKRLIRLEIIDAFQFRQLRFDFVECVSVHVLQLFDLNDSVRFMISKKSTIRTDLLVVCVAEILQLLVVGGADHVVHLLDLGQDEAVDGEVDLAVGQLVGLLRKRSSRSDTRRCRF